ncbi:MAG: fibronectin type III domain-containing protein, partial [Bacteroidota bacterium]
AAGAANAFVHAERQGGGFAGTQADASGNYTLSVTAGNWRVFATAQGYREAALATNPVVIVATSATGKDITLTTPFALNPPGSQPMETDQGGTVEDQTAGVRLVIPANALSSDGSSAIVGYSETNSTPDAPGAHALPGFEFTAQTADGAALTNFNDSITVQLDYTLAELAAQTAADGSSIDTLAEARAFQIGSYNPVTLTWVTYPTTMSGLAADRSIIVNPASLSDCVGGVRYTIVTDHFSLYAPVVATDVSAPSTPVGLAGTAGGTTSIGLSWTVTSGATSYDIYRSSSSGGTYTRLGSEPTVASGSTTSYTDSSLSAGTTYYYKITSLNGSGESAASAAVAVATTAAAVVASPSSGGGGGGAASSPVTTQPNSTTNVVRAPLPTSSPAVLPVSPVPTAPLVAPAAVVTPTLPSVSTPPPAATTPVPAGGTSSAIRLVNTPTAI